MALEVLNISANEQRTLLDDYERVQIDGLASHSDGWKISTFNSYEKENEDGRSPTDNALRMKDGYMLYSPPGAPHAATLTRMESWEYVWGTTAATKLAGASSIECHRYPAEMLQDGDVIDSDGPSDTATDRDRTRG